MTTDGPCPICSGPWRAVSNGKGGFSLVYVWGWRGYYTGTAGHVMVFDTADGPVGFEGSEVCPDCWYEAWYTEQFHEGTEYERISYMLRHGWNLQEIAEILGVNRTTLWRRIKKSVNSGFWCIN